VVSGLIVVIVDVIISYHRRYMNVRVLNFVVTYVVNVPAAVVIDYCCCLLPLPLLMLLLMRFDGTMLTLKEACCC
jgi:hypothetical protein